ncbi:MAG: hypothetical protein QXQ81_09260, partial [Candidatus Thorarchaeota archaeon]
APNFETAAEIGRPSWVHRKDFEPGQVERTQDMWSLVQLSPLGVGAAGFRHRHPGLLRQASELDVTESKRKCCRHGE